MTTAGDAWGITFLVGTGILLGLALTFVYLARRRGAPSVAVRCPITGHFAVVQPVVDETGYVTDLVTCRAFAPAEPVNCGLPCLTGGAGTRILHRTEV